MNCWLSIDADIQVTVPAQSVMLPYTVSGKLITGHSGPKCLVDELGEYDSVSPRSTLRLSTVGGNSQSLSDVAKFVCIDNHTLVTRRHYFNERVSNLITAIQQSRDNTVTELFSR